MTAQMLEPCPFCGGSATMEQTEDNRWSVGCDSADEPACMGYQSLTTFGRQGEATAAWNKRARSSAESAEPVAWRWTNDEKDILWKFGADAPSAAFHKEPLYAHPAPPTAASVREALKADDLNVDVLPDGRCIPAISDDALWTLQRVLHSNVPETDRPMSWSDFSPEQIQRLRDAAKAFLAALSEPAPAALTRDEIIEECAKAADAVASRAERLMDSDPSSARQTLAAVANGAMESAENIRELKSRQSQAETAAPAADDPLKIFEDNCWDLRCIDIPTGGGDADIFWNIVEHHMGAPNERVVGNGRSPLEALRDATSAITRPVRQP